MAIRSGVREGIRTRAGRRTPGWFVALSASLVVAWVTMGRPAFAGDLKTVVHFNIEAHTLDRALLEFGAQAHVQISIESTPGLLESRIEKLRGSYTGKAALAQLLKGTRLRYVVTGNTVAIQTVQTDELRHAAVPKLSGRSRSKRSTTGEYKSSDPPSTRRHLSREQTTPGLHEVIVTAQKYHQSALDVPISLVVIGSHQLQEDQIENLNDLQYDVPGLRVEGGGAQQRIVIRGVGNEYGNGAYVSKYIDDADVTSSGYSGASGYGGTDLQTYDLARVEVLRGPQGTLYGDGALGGTIRLITNAPELDRFEMGSNVYLPFTQYGAPSQNVQAMINTPIARSLALRIAGEFDHDGGWIDEPVAGLKNINGNSLTDTRIEGVWKPTSDLNLRVMQIVHRDAYGLSQGEDTTGNFIQPFAATGIPNGEKSFNMSNVTLTYDFSHVQLLNSSTYLNSNETINNYSEIETGVAAQLASALWDSERKFTQELRLARTAAEPWRWEVGGFYNHDRSGLVNGVEYLGLYSIPPTLSSLSSAIHIPGGSQLQGSNSWAAFGETSYTVADRLTAGVGVRYFRDRETATGSAYPKNPAATFSSTDPRAYLEYKVTSNVNTYISAAKGFRTGGFNPYVHPYGPEGLWSYELGTKMRVVGDHIVVNADAFWSNYSNYVAFAILPAVSSIFGESYNIGAARIRGLEGDVNWRLNASWLFGVSGDYLDAKIVSIASSAFNASYKVGDQVPLSSKYQLTTVVERDFQVTGVPGYVRVDYSLLSPQVSYGPLEYSSDIRILGLDASIQCNENLSVGIFGKNLTNDRGLLDPFARLGIASRPQPRTYGVDFQVSFGGP